MAATIPSALKAADIARFAQRAGQVEKAKPVVAYWCNYWIVEQILSKGLHQVDDECRSYTVNLMDKLEQTKSDFKENDAIADDMAGQAYIEQFALETFQRAENAMKVNKASRQTADTFSAAAAFLDLCQIWGPLEPEIAAKIKFAKYHSVRILKAMKAGEDPNLSNPPLEPPEPTLDPNDPEVRILNGESNTDHTRNGSLQPSILEVPDEHDIAHGQLAQSSTFDESLHPSRAPSAPPQTMKGAPVAQDTSEDYYQSAVPPQVSPLGPSSADQVMSTSGGYFPEVPSTVGQASDQTRSTTHQGQPKPTPEVSLPDTSALRLPSAGATGFHTPMPPSTNSLHSFPPHNVDDMSQFPPHPAAASASQPTAPPPANVSYPTGSSAFAQVRSHTAAQPNHGVPHVAVPHAASARVEYPPQTANQTTFVADEDAILKAQKHARWAISALNFEDVNTAVKELKGALESLGEK